MASIVILSLLIAETILLKSAVIQSKSFPSAGTKRLTFIVFSVIVPVLSTHKTSTLAKVSIHFIFRTKTFFLARRIMLTTIATLAKRYNPSGIIPITAATIPVILSLNVAPAKNIC